MARCQHQPHHGVHRTSQLSGLLQWCICSHYWYCPPPPLHLTGQVGRFFLVIVATTSIHFQWHLSLPVVGERHRSAKRRTAASQLADSAPPANRGHNEVYVCAEMRLPFLLPLCGPQPQQTHQPKTTSGGTGLKMMPVGKPSVGVGCGSGDGPPMTEPNNNQIRTTISTTIRSVMY